MTDQFLESLPVLSDATSAVVYGVKGGVDYQIPTSVIQTSINPQGANLVYAGPVSPPGDFPEFRPLVQADIPDLSSLYLAGTGGSLSTATINNSTFVGGTISGATITVNDNAFTVRDQTDTTKRFQFEASGVAAGATRVYSVPDGNTTLVGTDSVQTLTNKIVRTSIPSTAAAPLRIPHGSAPTSPANGDIWTTTAGLFVRVNSATVGPLAAATGSSVNSFNGRVGTVTLSSSDVLTALGYTPANASTAALDADVVHNTGNEDIAGIKSFTSGTITIDGSAGAGRSLYYRSGTSNRWRALASGHAETGGNAGSYYQLTAYADDGSSLVGTGLELRRDGVTAKVWGNDIIHSGNLSLENPVFGSTTDSTSSSKAVTINSNGYAGLVVKGDYNNTSGEVGGAYVSVQVDGGAVEGIFGQCQTADQAPDGTVFTGVVANTTLVGNKYGSLHLGAAGDVKFTVDTAGTLSGSGAVSVGGNIAAVGNVYSGGVIVMKQNWTLTAGNGMTGGGTGAADRTITLGTPGSTTLSSTNSVSATSHTHAFAPGGTTSQYIRGDGSLATFPAGTGGTVTSVAAGNGLNFTTITGAGSVTLGTPGSLTGSTTNAVTATSHTHAITVNLSASGTTGNITINNSAGTNAVIPVATATQSGLVSTGNQTWGGTKTAPNFVASSDARLKKNIKTRLPSERLADMLRFVEYLWKNNDEQGVGVIAQEVRVVAPEYVFEDENGMLAVDKAGLALECVIGLAARVRELENK